ncbi:MAG: ribulose bisphosphate carboxylase small subunit [Acidimicrobiaceae bacterium]|nr:ribulose bisphosphate carboxylase small subunit [Acidimicrobiaceae bacterium]
MRVTQGAFSFLPELTDEEVRAQIEYVLSNGWSIAIEVTDDPHPRNTYWEMWGLPMFELQDAAAVMAELAECKKTYPQHYVRLNAYDASYGRQTTALSFIVNRPESEPGFRLDRTELSDRQVRYQIRAYSADAPVGQRYQG